MARTDSVERADNRTAIVSKHPSPPGSATLPDRFVGFVRRVARGLARRAKNAARIIYRLLAGRALLDSVVAMQRDVAMLQQTQRSLRNELTGHLSFFSHDMTEQIHSSLARLDKLQSDAEETRNRVIHLDTSLHSRFNEVFNLHFPAVLEQLHETSALHLGLTKRSSEAEPQVSSRPPPVGAEPFEVSLARAQRDFPTVFTAWKERLDEHSEALAITEIGNAANAADVYSRLFRAFVEHHAAGAVLDVGCGPSGKPFYLSSYPSQLVSGIDPLVLQQHRDIEVIRGISEYLPWPDQSFSTVISATSLDHCLSLDRSIDEVVRVLQPNGKLLLWIGSIPGCPPYRPLDPGFVPADRFHLFHFDIAWLDPVLEQRFRMIDRVKLDRPGYSHVFYCLGLR